MKFKLKKSFIRKIELAAKYGQPKSKAYKLLQDQGLYLPNYKNSCITRDYLQNCIHRRVKTFHEENIRNFDCEINMTTEFIFAYYSHEDNGLAWGFGISRLPIKRWLINCCVSIFPDLPLSQAIINLDDLLKEDLSTKEDQALNLTAIHEAQQSLDDAVLQAIHLSKPRLKQLIAIEYFNRCAALIKKYQFLTLLEILGDK